MQPVAQDLLTSVGRTHQAEGEGQTACCTLVSSFRQSSDAPTVTVLAVAEGFGPGWTADEACQLALQALRNQFVQAEDQTTTELLASGLASANEAVYARACAYEADGEIGVWMLAAVVERHRCWLAQVGRGAAFQARRDGSVRKLIPHLRSSPEVFLGMGSALLPMLEVGSAVPGVIEDVRLRGWDLLLLLNGAAGDVLGESEIPGSVSRMDLDHAADRVLRLGQARLTASGASAAGRPMTQRETRSSSLGVLVAQLPGDGRAPGRVLSARRRAVFAGMSALLLTVFATGFWLFQGGWLEVRPSTAPASAGSTATPAVPASPTVLLLLPTVIPSPTPEPSPTVTATPPAPPASGHASPTQVPERVATVMPAESVTATPSLPTPTLLPTPSPTVPAGPIAVGGQVVVIRTEGLGVSVRDAPNGGALRLAILLDGEVMEVIGGPEEGVDMVWWQVRTAAGTEGWAVDRFLQGIAAP